MKGMDRIKRGSGFRGVLDYLFREDANASLIYGHHLAGHDPRSLAREFGAVRRLRPDIEKPVWHNALRLPAGETLSSEKWAEIAQDYMRRMGFSDDAPYAVVLHDDPEGQHIHIVASRVALDGDLYLGRNENLKSTQIISKLEREYGLQITKSAEIDEDGKVSVSDRRKLKKEEVEMAIRTGQEPPKARLQRLVAAAAKQGGTAVEFVRRLVDQGVMVKPNLASTGRLNGFSFSVDGEVWFKGSQLGKAYTWKGLQQQGVSYEPGQAEALRQVSDRGGVERSAGIGGVDRQGAGGAESGISGDAGRAGKTDQVASNSNQSDASDSGTRIEPDAVDQQAGERGRGRVQGGGRGGERQAGGGSDNGMDDRSRGRERIRGGVSKRRFSDLEIQSLKQQDPVPFLERHGFTVKREGKYYSVRQGKDELYRVSKSGDGVWLYTDHYGNQGGDMLQFCRDELGIERFVDQVYELAGGQHIGQIVTPEPERKREVKFPKVPQGDKWAEEEGRKYLHKRGISDRTINIARSQGFLAFIGGAVVFRGFDEQGRVRNAEKRSTHGKEKRTFANSDKRYTPILGGDPKRVVIVEGGVDALAAYDFGMWQGGEPPTVIMTGGAGLKAWIEMPHIARILEGAERITVALDNDPAEKRTADMRREQGARIEELYGKQVRYWKPPAGKDIADYWLMQQWWRGNESYYHLPTSPSGLDAASVAPQHKERYGVELVDYGERIEVEHASVKTTPRQLAAALYVESITKVRSGDWNGALFKVSRNEIADEIIKMAEKDGMLEQIAFDDERHQQMLEQRISQLKAVERERAATRSHGRDRDSDDSWDLGM